MQASLLVQLAVHAGPHLEAARLEARLHVHHPLDHAPAPQHNYEGYTVKKVTGTDFPVPSRDVTNQTLPGRFIILFPTRESLVSDIPAGDGEISNFIFQCIINIWWQCHSSLFSIIFDRLVLRRVHFTYSNFAWRLHGGVDVKWSVG